MTKLNLREFPIQFRGSSIMTVPANAEGRALIDKLRSCVRAYNNSADRADRLRVKIMGRLGKNNPAYKLHYHRHYVSIRHEHATRFDVYLYQSNPPRWPEVRQTHDLVEFL